MNKPTKLVNLSLQVVPINEQNAYPIIDEAIKIIQDSGVKYEVQPFSTIMEGEWSQLLAIIDQVKKAVFKAGGDELLFNIQIHMKRDKSVSFEEKTKQF